MRLASNPTAGADRTDRSPLVTRFDAIESASSMEEVLARPSAAPLRLLLAPAGPDELALRIVKRRGPPLLQPLRLALPPVLSAPARARALRERALPSTVSAELSSPAAPTTPAAHA